MDENNEDIMATLGGSLWNDLIADINLDSLERTLDEYNNASQQQQQTSKRNLWGGSSAPPNTPAGLPSNVIGAGSQQKPFFAGMNDAPFLEPASAASLVVSHQAQRQSELKSTAIPVAPTAPPSFLSFDLSAAEAFLAADSHKKAAAAKTTSRPPGLQEGEDESASNLVASLLLDEHEAYNINEEPTAASSFSLYQSMFAKPKTTVPPSLPPSAPIQTTDNDLNKELAKSFLSSLQSKPQVIQQPHPRLPLPPQVSVGGLPPGMVMTPNGPVPEAMIAAAMAHHNQLPPYAAGMPPGLQITPPQPFTGMMPPPPHMLAPHVLAPLVPKQQKDRPRFRQSDFPQLGADLAPESKTHEEEISEDEEYQDQPNAISLPRPLILFNNPHITLTPPIPAAAAQSSLMPPRDILYVVHTIIRPLLPCLADPFGQDYYFQLFVEQQQHGLPMHKNQPASKELKEQVSVTELKFRQVVVERAKDFKEQKQTLGQILKTDVRRPRAQLVTPVLHKMMLNGDMEDPTLESSDQSQRAQLWKARVLVDRGYTTFLDLLESHRLMMNESSPERREQIKQEVKLAVNELHKSFGIVNNDDIAAVDLSILNSALLLPKGQELLSRSMEGGCLPHASACALLPFILPALFKSTRSSDSAIAKEDRLCRSLASLVLLPNPAVPKEALMQSLRNIVAAASQGICLKQVLGYQIRAEVVRAILAQGGMLYRSETSSEHDKITWDATEAEFLELLSSN